MEIICADTSLIIEYFRRKDKTETRLYKLALDKEIAVPSIVAYEFLRGQKNSSVDEFLTQLLSSVASVPFDFACAQKAAEIYQQVKPTGNTIEPEDLLIAATALAWGYPVATLNPKHFLLVPGIRLV